MSNTYVRAQQTGPQVVRDGADIFARGTRDGIPFEATWKQALLLEGRCFQMTVGTLADAAVTALEVAGGAGTTTDLDQPEFAVTAANGLALIPLDIHISGSADLDANDEVAELVLIADVGKESAAAGTYVAETPINMITDGPGSRATCYSACESDVTDPTCDMILDHELVRLTAVTADTAAVAIYLHLHYAPAVPPILKGPAGFYGYGGGTSAVELCAAVVWAEVPEGRFSL